MDFERQDYVCSLLDCYEKLLTNNQKETMNYYFRLNMSLNEIAEEEGITKQGVKATISGALQKLESYEANLQLDKKNRLFRELQLKYSDDTELWKELEKLFKE